MNENFAEKFVSTVVRISASMAGRANCKPDRDSGTRLESVYDKNRIE